MKHSTTCSKRTQLRHGPSAAVQYEQVLELSRQDLSQRAIILQLKNSRRRLLKLFNAGTFPERAKRRHIRQVDHYLDYLKLRWEQGVRSVGELTQSIRELGYTGSADMVKRCVAPWRTAIERLRLRGSKPKPRSPAPLKLQRPSSDRLSWLLIKDDIVPRAGESALLDKLRKNCEPIRLGSELARSFGER